MNRIALLADKIPRGFQNNSAYTFKAIHGLSNHELDRVFVTAAPNHTIGISDAPISISGIGLSVLK
jgi:hypothetical protein